MPIPEVFAVARGVGSSDLLLPESLFPPESRGGASSPGQLGRRVGKDNPGTEHKNGELTTSVHFSSNPANLRCLVSLWERLSFHSHQRVPTSRESQQAAAIPERPLESQGSPGCP